MGEAEQQPPAAAKTIIGPQPGPQSIFLSTPADIAILGGAAGGGKTFGMLLEPLRHIGNPHFGGVIFRRTTPEITNEGAIWDESGTLYPLLGAQANASNHFWTFPAGATISFGHLEHDKTVYNWQGAQVPFLGFEELTHFSAPQFWYMLSRNRSTCGVRPYIRATCNPDPDSWVAGFISWWINQDTGFPIAERSGVLRWFVRMADKLIWADHPEQLAEHINPADGLPIPPKSVTFIPAKLSDNAILMAKDPGYLANLLALPPVERERLLGGNWKIRHGDSFFEEASLLVDGHPVDEPERCDAVFAVIDTATKTGKEHDGTAVTYFATNQHIGHPLIILDWDITQIEGATLEVWLPEVFANLERLAKACHARAGSVGCWIEDKASGMILLQQARRHGWNAHDIDSKLTSVGKDERAVSVSGYVHRGMIKIAHHAYHKVATFKDVTRNHLLGQVTNFRIGDKDATRQDDLLDTFCYGIAIALGDAEGF